MRALVLPLLTLRSGAMQQSTLPRARVQTVSFVRHGQALHNVRAEGLRSNGCDFDTFLATMKEDDAYDADLTDLGRSQAAAARGGAPEVDVVFASPLSRAIETAALVCASSLERDESPAAFVALENLREWNGLLLNGKRRPRTEIAAKFPALDVAGLAETDETWDAEILEVEQGVADRGVDALSSIAARPEERVAVVAHGGLLAAMFNATLTGATVVDAGGILSPRFLNCECRTVSMRTDVAGGRAVYTFGEVASFV